VQSTVLRLAPTYAVESQSHGNRTKIDGSKRARLAPAAKMVHNMHRKLNQLGMQ
jgi:hypothetical protein